MPPWPARAAWITGTGRESRWPGLAPAASNRPAISPPARAATISGVTPLLLATSTARRQQHVDRFQVARAPPAAVPSLRSWSTWALARRVTGSPDHVCLIPRHHRRRQRAAKVIDSIDGYRGELLAQLYRSYSPPRLSNRSGRQRGIGWGCVDGRRQGDARPPRPLPPLGGGPRRSGALARVQHCSETGCRPGVQAAMADCSNERQDQEGSAGAAAVARQLGQHERRPRISALAARRSSSAARSLLVPARGIAHPGSRSATSAGSGPSTTR